MPSGHHGAAVSDTTVGDLTSARHLLCLVRRSNRPEEGIANLFRGAPSAPREWDCGWFICADTNRNNSCNANEPVLLRYDSPNRTQISRTGGNNRIIFNRYGLVDGPYLGFNLVPHNQSISHPATRGLCMGSGGRIRTVQSEEVPCKE